MKLLSQPKDSSLYVIWLCRASCWIVNGVTGVRGEESEDTLAYFLNCHNASNIVRDKTCFKILSSPSCIDLIISNKPGCFQNTITTSIRLSDCHKVFTTILKASFKKALPKEVFYRIINTLIMKISKRTTY